MKQLHDFLKENRRGKVAFTTGTPALGKKDDNSEGDKEEGVNGDVDRRIANRIMEVLHDIFLCRVVRNQSVYLVLYVFLVGLVLGHELSVHADWINYLPTTFTGIRDSVG